MLHSLTCFIYSPCVARTRCCLADCLTVLLPWRGLPPFVLIASQLQLRSSTRCCRLRFLATHKISTHFSSPRILHFVLVFGALAAFFYQLVGIVWRRDEPGTGYRAGAQCLEQPPPERTQTQAQAHT